MGLLDVYRCPNTECWWDGEGKKGEYCPECGLELIPTGIRDGAKLLNKKQQLEFYKERKKEAKMMKKEKKLKEQEENAKQNEEKKILKAVLHPNQTDEDIKKNIMIDLQNLQSHEAGTKWMRIGTLLSFNSTEQMIGAGFKAIIDQNKVIIRQNELMLRQLERLIEEK